MNPALIGAIGSIAGGFLGGQQEAELSPEQQRLYRFLLRLAREKRQYSRGIPGSDPAEQAALAQAKALSGEGIAQQREGLLASLGTDNPNAADALERFGSNAAGTQSGIDTAMLLQFLQARQQAGNDAAGIASMASGPASAYRSAPSGPDLGGIFGQMAQQYAFQKASKPAAPLQPPTTGVQMNPNFGDSLPHYQPDRYRTPTYGNPSTFFGDYSRGTQYF